MFNIPPVVGELLAGLLIGPSLLGLISGNNFLDKAAEIGVILLMFYAGLGTNLKDLKNAGLKSLLIATGGVIMPLFFGRFSIWCLMDLRHRARLNLEQHYLLERF